jgi:predicted MFS family arabinose efflux permease
LIAGIFLMDMGVQGGHVSNQTRVFALREDARSRINTVYMFQYFVGGALGSFFGSLAWSTAGWSGVCALCGLFLSLGVFAFLKGSFKEVLND